LMTIASHLECQIDPGIVEMGTPKTGIHGWICQMVQPDSAG
jgi:hypothetical protein